jgi:glyoxylase-like metal-dependent hydrolase (beta-lactamase superfamily II)
MRTLIAFGFALGFPFALAACGGGSSSNTSGAGGTGGGTGSTSTSTSSSASTTTTSSAASSSASGAGGGSSAAAFKIEVFSSDPASTDVNSVLISGETDAVLVDTQFFLADANKVIELVNASGKTLKTVFLTHAHPDHYLGLDPIHTAFPNAEVVATQDVVDDLNKSGQATFDALKVQLGALIADKLFVPTVIAADSIELEGQKLTVIQLPEPGESAHAAALGVVNPNALIAGDVLYNNVHLVLSECASLGWLNNLATLKALGYGTFYPGHGAEAKAAIFNADAQYIKDVVPIMDAAATQDDAKAQIKQAYPAYQSDFLLNFSVGQYFTNCKK